MRDRKEYISHNLRLFIFVISFFYTVTLLAESTYSFHSDTWPMAMVTLKNELSKHEINEGYLNKEGYQHLKCVHDQFPIETDWFLAAINNDLAKWVKSKDTELLPPIVQKIQTENNLKNLVKTKSEIDSQIDTETAYKLFVKACQLRRSQRLHGIISNTSEIVFTKHHNLGGSHYAYTEGQSDAQSESHFSPGSSLCLMKVNSDSTVTVKELLNSSLGVIRDPDVSFNGDNILFAWKKDRNDDYHLYEVDKAGQGLRQITFGEGVADYEGIYLPSGDIVFNSTRCVQIVDCFWTEVSNLYTCDSAGNYLRRLSFDQVHTNYPQILEDGRIIYTRWDYNDRGQIYPQPLFQMNPDGTNQTEYYGNNSWFPTTILHARGIPGENKLIAVLSGHHTTQQGKLAIINPSMGRQENEGVQLIAPVRDTPAERIDQYGQSGDVFQYPIAINDQEFIVSYSPFEEGRNSYNRHFAIYWMDTDGNRELLVYDPHVSCNQPVALKERTGYHVRPNMVDYTKDHGIYYIKDVYHGPGLKGIERGVAKSIRVVALDFRVAGIGSNGSHGVAGGALSSTPPSARNGTWDVKIVLGTSPIYSDGSAMFKVPDRTPVYFQVLDEKNHVIQTMRSWSTLQPGEIFSCIGCHESKNSVPPATSIATIAMQKGALELEPFYGPPRGFSFIKEIQPIFNKSCISCHDGDKAFSLLAKENIDGQAKRKWSDSYLYLTKIDDSFYDVNNDKRLVSWIPVQSQPSMLPPYYAGAARSKFIKILEKGHKGIRLTPEEMDKISCWIDLLVPYCGDYKEANAWTDDEIRKYVHFEKKRQKYADIDRGNVQAFLNNQ